ncbi:hypothetical protein RIF29_09489 [Crotalaria pallida]|uniref:Uncharacterized protein n=1 Tax=Crotalaria pallida TaxID=3830 RepID=A0AAN9IJH3_CROPI
MGSSWASALEIIKELDDAGLDFGVVRKSDGAIPSATRNEANGSVGAVVSQSDGNGANCISSDVPSPNSEEQWTPVNIYKKEMICRENLVRDQANLASDPLNIHLQKLEKEGSQELLKVSEAAILFLRQKENEHCLKEGDQNSKYFHAAINKEGIGT